MFAAASPLAEHFSPHRGADIRLITDADLGALQALLDKHSATDPYQKSATYYAMTGRDGLWWVHDGDSAVIFCRHPNVDNEFLVFPPLGSCGGEMLGRVVRSISATGEGVRLARFTLSASAHFPNARAVSEDVLDWKFPVRTLDTNLVVAMRGRKFQGVRTALRRFDESQGVEVCDFNARDHGDQVLKLVDEWGCDDDQKYGPYRKLVDLSDVLPIAGRVVFIDGKVAGFSLWEETDKTKGIANNFAAIASQEYRGLSEFIEVDMCRTLSTRGFGRVCLGGSETEGLDRYKRKFRPVDSVVLNSLVATVPVGASGISKGALVMT